jgi:mono/diheme cytochrome c family protein
MGLLAVMLSATIAAPSLAQTNIDQGKSPAELFANDCAACHKTTRGLANGENSLSLSVFLREHYTASRDQAAALAAYVLANGGNAPAPKSTARGE